MKRLAIVPARGGSKRLPKKNLKLFGGAPLICRTVGVAKNAFDKVIVSSDDSEILGVVEETGSVERDLRPASLATDSSKVIDTVCHYYDREQNQGFDQIWLLLPTCPLRSETDLQQGLQQLNPQVDGIVSVTEFEFPPSLALAVDEQGFLSGYGERNPFAEGDSRSQDHKPAIRPNGAFYGMWWEAFGKHRNFFRGSIIAMMMPRLRSLDIDTEEDFQLAEIVVNANKL